MTKNQLMSLSEVEESLISHSDPQGAELAMMFLNKIYNDLLFMIREIENPIKRNAIETALNTIIKLLDLKNMPMITNQIMVKEMENYANTLMTVVAHYKENHLLEGGKNDNRDQ